MSAQRSASPGSALLRRVAVMSAILIVLLLVIALVLRNLFAYTASINTSTLSLEDRTALTLERAQDAVNAVELLLSFLEGASVLVGFGFTAATLYGLRSAQDLRKEMESEIARIETLRQDLVTQLAELEAYRPYLENLTGLRLDLEQSQTSLKQTIDNVSRVFQAEQEFRLKNFHSAYALVTDVLEREPDNRLALYLAGWLEVQHLGDRLDQGIAHLEKVVRQDANWPAAKAAYGVGLRRKARASTGEAREKLFLRAEGMIKEALSQSPRLMDFEGESFWGPVGGILRELNQVDGAIYAYEKALEITPNSSYPWGNLATLYLLKAKSSGDRSLQTKALNAFVNTYNAAQAELKTNPNNYYLLMDIAQSLSILGRRDPAHFDTAQKTLMKALKLEVSRTSLETSLRGWQDLLDNCPADWPEVRSEIEQALSIIHTAIEHSVGS